VMTLMNQESGLTVMKVSDGYFIYNHGLRVCVGIPNVGSGLSNHA